METKQNVIEIEPDGIKKSLNKVLRSWAARYAEAEKKGPLKSNPYSQLRAAGSLNADYILDEAALIEAKQSKLSSGQRAVVSTIMNDAIRDFLATEAEKARAATEKLADATKKATTATKKLAKAVSAIDKKPAASRTRKTTTVKKSPAKAPKTPKE